MEMPTTYSPIIPKAFLDKNGLIYFARKLNNYPTNDVLVAVVEGVQDALDEKIDTSSVGTANGIAELDEYGKVPSSQLPSYVDDVYEYTDRSAFPLTGQSGIIYVAIDTGFQYRWTGSIYSQLPGVSYETDGTYNAYTNKVATVQTVTNAITSLQNNAITTSQIDELCSDMSSAESIPVTTLQTITEQQIDSLFVE